MNTFLEKQIAELKAQDLHRSLRDIESAQGPTIRLNGRVVHNFSSNDYLGLASHPSLKEAASDALAAFGTGSGASRLISGNLPPCRELEEELARFKGSESALVFGSGYAAAAGTLPALLSPKDVVILDKLCHACLIDAAKLSGAHLRVYPHLHVEKLKDLLEWAACKHPDSNILIVTETVFSMDGDVAPLDAIVELKNKFGAWLMIDEAHA
ncbi:MAG TPA: aminotransferase class I/II-fold pyridoxal phosphate-dependent enzyme, partial [Sphingomonadales bacterium]|nr:aminotransferase class I/II-fold pyridoxal phosphate-dependent enzyme [Sphingomonadales bacterium]